MGDNIRVMWLLNHTTARKFEIKMLKEIGIKEIFLPKVIPLDPTFRSASIDFSEDQYLTIPPEDLAILNAADWYSGPSKKVWDVANKYFDILFFIAHDSSLIKQIADYFHGIAIWRAYGLDRTLSYTALASFRDGVLEALKKLGNRFYFGEAYRGLYKIESEPFVSQATYLPLGMPDIRINDQYWQGSDKKIFLICPDIIFNPYYKTVYENFIKDFTGFPYSIGGVQSLPVEDPNVLGFVSKEQHILNMQQFRVMFYPSTEPNHVHYHPFEAVRAGMPLIFMANNLLDRLGGINQPGRCKSIQEAREKISRILNDDWKFINEIKKSQVKLLDVMKFENCIEDWRNSFKKILKSRQVVVNKNPLRHSKKRVAVVMCGTPNREALISVKLFAEAMALGSREYQEEAEVVLACSNLIRSSEEEFINLTHAVHTRMVTWKLLSPEAAHRAMVLAGNSDWKPAAKAYIVPDDSMNYLCDCDAWVITSGNLHYPLLPIRPFILLFPDSLQSHRFIENQEKNSMLYITQNAKAALFATACAKASLLNYGWLPANKLFKMPFILPLVEIKPEIHFSTTAPYFLWQVGVAVAKQDNDEAALKALKIYYEELNGQLHCKIIGADEEKLLKNPFFEKSASRITRNAKLKSHLSIVSGMVEKEYHQFLAHAAFLWHPALIHDGVINVIEAVSCGIPVLACDSSVMRELDQQFQLQISWVNTRNSYEMAEQLKWMEDNLLSQKAKLPTRDTLERHSMRSQAKEYWKIVREHL